MNSKISSAAVTCIFKLCILNISLIFLVILLSFEDWKCTTMLSNLFTALEHTILTLLFHGLENTILTLKLPHLESTALLILLFCHFRKFTNHLVTRWCCQSSIHTVTRTPSLSAAPVMWAHTNPQLSQWGESQPQTTHCMVNGRQAWWSGINQIIAKIMQRGKVSGGKVLGLVGRQKVVLCWYPFILWYQHQNTLSWTFLNCNVAITVSKQRGSSESCLFHTFFLMWLAASVEQFGLV